MIKVVVSGAKGRMGNHISQFVGKQNDFELVAGVDPVASDGEKLAYIDETGQSGEAPLFPSLDDALGTVDVDVVIDFTAPAVAIANVKCVLSHGVNCVLGTTGVTEEALQVAFDESATGDAALFCAPNFTTGAVLMMLFSQTAAKFFEDAEVLEFHHSGKKDAPSGAAVKTAKLINEVQATAGICSKAPGRETEIDGFAGARGANSQGVRLHSIRSNGYVASQEVIFGSPGQTLSIRHDSIDRDAYMPGIAMAVRAVINMQGVTVGLDKLML
ncbi:MAG: 4-hydroxy-tetrahydrodipicolinate reductase [Coriobacteriales bacterium]|nr:4-hydroxy-tetrahydrodipicolinate reductase [Coriobacteriales bacterium]